MPISVPANNRDHPVAFSASPSIASALGLTKVEVSDWQVVRNESVAGSLEVDGPTIAAGWFEMMVVNRRSGQALKLQGAGAGVGVGFGLGSKAELSFDLPSVPNLPGWNGPIYLAPGRSNASGALLFAGTAVAVSISAGAGLEAGVTMLLFCDTPAQEISAALGGRIGGAAGRATGQSIGAILGLGSGLGTITAIKAATIMSGVDRIIGASAGVTVTSYVVISTPLYECALTLA